MFTGTTRVADVMTTAPKTLDQSATVAQALRSMRAHHIRHLPITSSSALVGLVSERDLFLLLSLNGVEAEKESIEEAMTEDPYAVHADTPLADVAEAMAQARYGSVVVVDDKGVVGIVTTVDLLSVLAKMLRAGA